MEKCRKYLYKNSLLARRRNNTATKMLQDQLKYLEQKYFRSYRQHLRDKSRIQSELRMIEDNTSDYREDVALKFSGPNAQLKSPLEERYSRNISTNKDIRIFKQKQKSLLKLQTEHFLKSENIVSSSGNRLRHLNKDADKPNSRSSESVEDMIDYLETRGHSITSLVMQPDNKEFNNQQMSSINVDTFTEVEPSNNSSGDHRHTVLGKNEFVYQMEPHAAVPTKASSSRNCCKYNTESQPHSLCHHFPCVTPTTYHSFGRRKNIECLQTVETASTAVTQLKVLEMLKISTERKLNTSSDNHPSETASAASIPSTGEQENSHNKTTPPAARRRLNSSSEQLQLRQGIGSPFHPASAEGVLEYVRTGSKVPPPLNCARARTSTRDKIRGLKQTMYEMRARNDRSKPQDWAVNYGQQIPRRILLNPVLP